MGDLVNGGADGLNLAHAFSERNVLGFSAEKTVRIAFQCREFDRDRRRSAQRLQKNLIVLHVAGQLIGKMREGFSVGL